MKADGLVGCVKDVLAFTLWVFQVEGELVQTLEDVVEEYGGH